MEPPAKRSRIGPSPFGADDVDDDELSLRPEEVNARRDPGYQLQKSRAIAAFKLKATFERIFEKYEKDFTGIGDEIDLRTGEIVVNNGHIQSLKTSNLVGAEEDGDCVVDEEGRILQGKTEQRLSRLGQDSLALTIQPRPPVLSAPYSAMPQFMGRPALSSMVYPERMGVGNYTMPMPYGMANPPQSLDPAWSAPDLPMPVFGGGFGSMMSARLPRRTKVKVAMITAGSAYDDNEDDLLLGVSTSASDTTPAKALGITLDKAPGTAQSSSPRPPNGGMEGVVVESDQSRTPHGVQQARYKIPETTKKTAPKRKTASKPFPDASKARTTTNPLSPASAINSEGNQPTAALREPPRTGNLKAPQNTELDGQRKPNSINAAAKKGKRSTSKPKPQRPAASSSERPSETREPDLYLDAFLPEGKFTAKPVNQKLQVEIRVLKPADISAFRIMSPEPSPEPEVASSTQADGKENITTDLTEVDKVQHPLDPQDVTIVEDTNENSGRDNVPTPAEHGEQLRPKPAETFSRNTLDPSYAFSDEEEPTLPRGLRQAPRKKATSTVTRKPKPVKASVIVALDQSSPTPRSSRDKNTDGPAPERNLPTPDGSSDSNESDPSLEETNEQPTPHSAPSSSSGAEDESKTPASLLMTKPRRGRGKRRAAAGDSAAGSVENPPTQPIEADANTVVPEQASPKKRKRRHSETPVQDTPDVVEPAVPSSPPELASHDWTIPETPEASPQPQSSPKLPARQSSPELGTAPAEVIPATQEAEPASPANTNRTTEPAPAAELPATDPPTATTAGPATQLPKTPAKKFLRRFSHPNPGGSSAKTGILSLLSDDDEDELSLGPEDFTPSGSRRRKPHPSSSSSSGERGRVRTLLMSSSTRSKSTVTRRGVIVGSHGKAHVARTPPSKGRFGASLLARLSASRVSTLAIRSSSGGSGRPPNLMRSSRAPSPVPRVGSELIQTPGGSMRRCGEGEFRCDRDFCFVCLR